MAKTLFANKSTFTGAREKDSASPVNSRQMEKHRPRGEGQLAPRMLDSATTHAARGPRDSLGESSGKSHLETVRAWGSLSSPCTEWPTTRSWRGVLSWLAAGLGSQLACGPAPVRSPRHSRSESLLPSPQRPEAALDTRELGEEWGPLTAGWTGPVCIGFKRRNLTRNLTLREGAEHSGSRSGLLRPRRCPGLDMRPWHVFHFSQSQGLPW